MGSSASSVWPWLAAVSVAAECAVRGRGLPRQHHETAGVGLVLEVTIPLQGIEKSYPDHFLFTGDAIGFHHLRRETRHASRFRNLLLDEQPEPLQLGDVRQLLALAENSEPCCASRILGGDQRVMDKGGEIFRCLPDRTEHLAEITGALLQFGLEPGKFGLVGGEGLFQGIAPLPLGGQLVAQFFEQQFLVGMGGEKGLLPFTADRRVTLLGILDLAQQLIQVGGVIRLGKAGAEQAGQQ